MSTEMTRSAVATIALPDNLMVALEFAERISRTALIPEALRGKPDEVLAVMVYGRELGMDPMRAVRSINFIKGTPTLKAEAMSAMVMASAVCEELTLLESTDRVATYYAKRVGASNGVEMAYTIEQAKRAGLTRNPTWQSHPEAMLRARAVTSICRAVFPDVYGGLYSEDEAQEIADRREQRAEVRVEPRAERPRAAAAETVARRAEMLRRGSEPPAAGVVEGAEVVRTGRDTLVDALADCGVMPADFDEWCAHNGRPVFATMDHDTAAQAADWLLGAGAETVKRWHTDRAKASAPAGPIAPHPDELQMALKGVGIPAALADAWAQHKGYKPATAAGARALWFSIMEPADGEWSAFMAEWDKANPEAEAVPTELPPW